MKNEQWIFANRPTRGPDDTTFALQSCEYPSCPDNGVIIQTMYFSVDPYMRGRLSQAKSYAEGWQLGKPGQGGMVGKIVESHTSNYNVGDIVVGSGDWKRYLAVSKPQLIKVETSVAPYSYLGMIGMPGLSAYFPLEDIGKPKPSDTVYISGAAGVVGLVAGQICANVKGCKRVIGSAGTDEKVEYLKSVGYHDAFNYNKIEPAVALPKLCPDGIDVYFDNVGGPTLDAAFANMNTFGRIIACGGISQYNKTPAETYGLKNFMATVRSQLTIGGFIVGRWARQFPQGRQALAAYIADGKIKEQYTFYNGFESLPDAFQGLFKGKNLGKMVVSVGGESKM